MVPFIYLRQGKLYRVEDNVTKLVVDFAKWNGAPLPEGFNASVFFFNDLALKKDGRIYITSTKYIFLYDPGHKTVTKLFSLPLDNVSGYITSCSVRQLGGAEHLYFLRYKDYELNLFRLVNDTEVVFYGAVPHEDLLVPDVWCTPGGTDVPHIVLGSNFAFGKEDSNLYVSTVNQAPSGFFLYSNADLSSFSGKPTRIHLNLEDPCLKLHCRDSNTLYYLSKSNSLRVIRRIDLLPSPVSDEVVYGGDAFPDFDDRVSSVSFDPNLALKHYYSAQEIRWVQRSLNIVFSPTPLLQVDGKLGSKTKAAVLSFQKYFLLQVDGKPGPQTRAKLLQVLRAHFS